jgi:hypothetical protein
MSSGVEAAVPTRRTMIGARRVEATASAFLLMSS